MRASLLITIGASTVLGAATSTPSRAFDNTQFCQAVGQLTRAEKRDIGTWINRTTRNDGVELFCDRKIVHFKRYASTPGSGLREAWREARDRGMAEHHLHQSRCGAKPWKTAGSSPRPSRR